VQLLPTNTSGVGECDFSASLLEAVVPSDPLTSDMSRAYPFHGYSQSADASGQAVFANYGLDEDFEKVRGISLLAVTADVSVPTSCWRCCSWLQLASPSSIAS
jgi:hypothetical protein